MANESTAIGRYILGTNRGNPTADCMFVKPQNVICRNHKKTSSSGMGLNSDHHLWWLGFALGIISGCSLRIAQINTYKKAGSEGNNIFYDDTHRTSLSVDAIFMVSSKARSAPCKGKLEMGVHFKVRSKHSVTLVFLHFSQRLLCGPNPERTLRTVREMIQAYHPF